MGRPSCGGPVRPRLTVPFRRRSGRRCRRHAQTVVATPQAAQAGIGLAVTGLEVGVAADAHVHLGAGHHRLDPGFGVGAGGGVLCLGLAQLGSAGGDGTWIRAVCGHRVRVGAGWVRVRSCASVEAGVRFCTALRRARTLYCLLKRAGVVLQGFHRVIPSARAHRLGYNGALPCCREGSSCRRP